jgi:sec-independent protein translocase protein TatB
MAADASRRPSPPDGAPPSDEVAANLGTMVGEHVRRLIDCAEQFADDLHRQAVEDVSSDHEAVHHTAILVQDRIDVIEASVARLLQQLREEVQQIADDADSASRSPPQPAITGHAERLPADESHAEVQEQIPPADQPAEDEGSDKADAPPAAEDVAAAPPAAEEPAPAPKPAPAAQRRGGLFRRLQRRESTLGCAICGRTPDAGANSREIKRWHATGDVTLCPDCQAEGWR